MILLERFTYRVFLKLNIVIEKRGPYKEKTRLSVLKS